MRRYSDESWLLVRLFVRSFVNIRPLASPDSGSLQARRAGTRPAIVFLVEEVALSEHFLVWTWVELKQTPRPNTVFCRYKYEYCNLLCIYGKLVLTELYFCVINFEIRRPNPTLPFLCCSNVSGLINPCNLTETELKFAIQIVATFVHHFKRIRVGLIFIINVPPMWQPQNLRRASKSRLHEPRKYAVMYDKVSGVWQWVLLCIAVSPLTTNYYEPMSSKAYRPVCGREWQRPTTDCIVCVVPAINERSPAGCNVCCHEPQTTTAIESASGHSRRAYQWRRHCVVGDRLLLEADELTTMASIGQSGVAVTCIKLLLTVFNFVFWVSVTVDIRTSQTVPYVAVSSACISYLRRLTDTMHGRKDIISCSLAYTLRPPMQPIVATVSAIVAVMCYVTCH